MTKVIKILSTCYFLICLMACERPDPQVTSEATLASLAIVPTMTPISLIVQDVAPLAPPPTPIPAGSTRPVYVGLPTPNPTRPGSGNPNGELHATHIVEFGETLGYIAQEYHSTIEELLAINNLSDSDFLSVGQVILVPAGAATFGLDFKLIPDSELVYGPAARNFEPRAFAEQYQGYLLAYQEEIEGQLLAGPEIVGLVADRFSLNPRLLLAALEFRAGWLTQAAPIDNFYPMGHVAAGYEGLYQQLAWVADQLNGGYYGRAEGGQTTFLIGGLTRLSYAPTINDGTAGVQNWLAAHDGANYETWLQEASSDGFFATYNALFGNPFAYTFDPLWPAGLSQPPLQLAWPKGQSWYFTGGPHGGWASGSAWAALDFVPSLDQLGCYQSEEWVTAMSDGLVVRSDFGAVVVDLDKDGFAGTGWAITYMHLESRERVPAGTFVQVGDPLGHPSCEGGYSNGTHVHISRTYNGRWVSADGPIPFAMGGWLSQGLGQEYDGQLIRNDTIKEACQCRAEGNAIPNE